jgi:hypothetical protein
MSYISRPASLRRASRRAGQCDLTAQSPDCVRRAARRSFDNRAPEELRSPGLVAFAGAKLDSSEHRRAAEEMQEFALLHRGTAVPGLQQLPLPDSLMTSNSVDGLSELV